MIVVPVSEIDEILALIPTDNEWIVQIRLLTKSEKANNDSTKRYLGALCVVESVTKNGVEIDAKNFVFQSSASCAVI